MVNEKTLTNLMPVYTKSTIVYREQCQSLLSLWYICIVYSL